MCNSVCLPGRTEAVIGAQIPKSFADQLGMVTPVQKDSISPHVLVAYSVSQAEGRNVFLRIMNTSNCDIQLQAGQQIGEYCPLIDTLLPNLHEPSTANHTGSNNGPSVACTNFSQNQIKVELEAALSPSLKQDDRQILLQTLLKYSDVFHDSLGHTDVITHKIDTGDATPIQQYPRRLPYAYREEVKRQIHEMLEQGVIQESISPWASPIVLVKKKDGKFRFCVDYRKLNKVTKKDAHPLPRIDDLLDSLQGSNIFSTLDLRSGYWQVSMSPEDCEKTAFSTPDGLWEFLRMPFGVSNGCATFHRGIQIVLSGLKYDTCLCYFDDIIIPSTSITQHCERLQLVLDRFRKHNLRVKASKCCFGAHEVTYLGHVVSAKGVQTDPGKIKAVAALDPPKTVEQVRSFLGLAGYYRNFIPRFAMVSAPLVALTKKGTKFTWLDQHERGISGAKKSTLQCPRSCLPRL